MDMVVFIKFQINENMFLLHRSEVELWNEHLAQPGGDCPMYILPGEFVGWFRNLDGI